MIIVKNTTSSTYGWYVYHKSIGAGNVFYLNSTSASGSGSNVWNGWQPDATNFYLGTNHGTNGGSNNMVAYCFAEKTGYSKISSYTGNNNNNGAFIYTGFAPSFVMIKNTQTARDWMMWDNKRTDGNPNLVNKYFRANTNEAEGSNTTTGLDFLSNGFKCRNTFGSTNHAETYAYIAFGQSLVGSNNVPCTAR